MQRRRQRPARDHPRRRDKVCVMSLASIAHTPAKEGVMRMTIAAAALACASLLAGPAHAQPKATADIKDASGKSLGEAVLVQRDGAVEIDMTLTGLPKGMHAFHIHE